MSSIRLAFIAALIALSGCAQLTAAFNTTTTPGETDGQLYCQIAKSDGTSEVVSIINADVPGAVLVTGIASAVVAAECTLAVAKVPTAVSAVPVPPATPAAAIAISPPVQTPATS